MKDCITLKLTLMLYYIAFKCMNALLYYIEVIISATFYYI